MFQEFKIPFKLIFFPKQMLQIFSDDIKDLEHLFDYGF